MAHLLPNLLAMNFVIDEALEGGVTGSLSLDSHGEALPFLMLGGISAESGAQF